MTLRTGFIGLGAQGGPIVERMLQQGVDVGLWARRPESLEPFLPKGAKCAETPAALARERNSVGICVLSDNDVREVVLGDTGVLSGMGPGGLMMIHSTVAPDTVIELDRLAREKGVHLLDAPVSGGARGALAGTMTVMVGGETSALDIARPVLESFATNIPHLGTVGAGQMMKLLNNTLCYANMVLSISALELAEQLGIDRRRAGEIMATSSGRSNGLDLVINDDRLQKASVNRAPSKDVLLFQDLLRKAGLPERDLATVASEIPKRLKAFAAHVLKP